MNNVEKVRAWRTIETALSRIPDPILRNCIRYEFQTRAERDWGFCPAEIKIKKEDVQEMPELLDWEKDLYDRIDAYIKYGVDIRTDEEKRKLETETLNNMIDFINRGGTYWEIPADIRCDSLKAIYDKAFDIVFEKN